MKTLLKLSILFASLLPVITSCKKDDDEVTKPRNINESELITTVKLVMVDSANANSTYTAVFKDEDGEGGNAPSIFDTIRLAANTTYNVEVILLDESKTPVDTISKEVEEEGKEHQFFYSASGGADIHISYLDADDNGVPVGLKVKFRTGSVTSGKNGKLKVVLKHQGENKPVTGLGDPSIGDTDVEIDFPVLLY
ncbi:MAG TPA: hypothetical protein VIK89_15185 [Cytophagaceae bacterium]